MNQMMANNLHRISWLPRLQLLWFLNLEGSKTNTEKLRKRARIVAISAPDAEIERKLNQVMERRS